VFAPAVKRPAIAISSLDSNVLVAIFAETESPAARLLGEQDMTRQDAVNFIVHGIIKGGRDAVAR
jgi:ATP-dependent Clp protease ATP-binding subunit ClpA